MGASQSIIAQGPPIVAVEHEMKTLHDHLLAQIQRDANGWTKAQARAFAKELHALMDKVAAFGEKEEAAVTTEATAAAPAAADAVAKEEKTAAAVTWRRWSAGGHRRSLMRNGCWMAASWWSARTMRRRSRRCSQGGARNVKAVRRHKDGWTPLHYAAEMATPKSSTPCTHTARM